ncbi:MAG: GIY-YIG nuclease family protein [Bacteroidota bacterium]
MERGGCVYITSNEYNTTLYIGVTSNLEARIYEHKKKIYPNSFTAKYNCNKLVYFESFISIEEAIAREKQLKGGSRMAKIKLIERTNPSWKDLSDEIL